MALDGVVLRLTGITKRFPGVVANRDVSLEVRAGEIHGLLGENGAGKTTLMNAVAGLLAPDAGEIEIEGRRVFVKSPLEAKKLGVGMVHQHFMLVPTMTVAENIALGLEPERLARTDLRRVAARVREVSKRYGLVVDPEVRVEQLSVGARQRVEIVRLLFGGPDLLILDEPTGVLTPQEWSELAKIMRRLAEEGKAIVFITHKLDELFDVAQRCTVMRDGEVIGTLDIADATKPLLATMMVGREVVLRVGWTEAEIGPPVLTVESLTLVDGSGPPRLSGITFELRAGEILGIAGVDGNGQQELVEVLTGLVQPTEGSIAVDGHPVRHLNPVEFIRRGGAVIHADRHRDGLAPDLTLEDNLLMTELASERFSRRGWLRRNRIHDQCAQLMQEYDIRALHPRVLMRQLSGGNQQKAVLARELSRQPKLLIAAQPTRGLDVGAVEFVYGRLLAHKQRGGATLLISTELDEVLSLADRIAVMANGRFVRILSRHEATLDTLGLLMAGQIAP